MTASIEINEESATDVDGIRAVNEAAFDGPAEARLVDALRDGGRVVLSLVARQQGRVVGHLMMSNARIVDGFGGADCVALAPMAVLPEVQGEGVGTRLVERALELAAQRGHGVVVVLGHPEYYPRFGFEPAGPRGILCPYDAPPEAWLVRELRAGALDDVAGVVEYAPEFAAV